MVTTFRGGSLLILDSVLSNVKIGFLISSPKGSTESEKFSLSIDNLDMHSVGVAVLHSAAGKLLTDGARRLDCWVSGKVYDETKSKGSYVAGDALTAIHPKTESLIGGKGYFEREKPTYAEKDVSSFLSARLLAKGDGITDDTFALTLAIAMARFQDKILYIPMGSYIVKKTILIPVGARIVGECWSQIVAKGAFFEDPMSPNPLVQVGRRDDTGSVEIQDLLFTVEGATAGAVLMEWNIAEDEKGSAAMWGMTTE